MLWLPVNVSSLNLSLFLAFPLHSNVDSGRCWFVVENWRILPRNGNLLLRIEDLNGIIILSLPNALLEGSVLIIYSDSWICFLIISPLVPLHPSASSEFLHSLTPPHYSCCISLHSDQEKNLEGLLPLYTGALSLWHLLTTSQEYMA